MTRSDISYVLIELNFSDAFIVAAAQHGVRRLLEVRPWRRFTVDTFNLKTANSG